MQRVRGDRHKCLQGVTTLPQEKEKRMEPCQQGDVTTPTHLVPSYIADGRLGHVRLHKTVRNVASGSQSSRIYPCAVEDGMKGSRTVDRSMHEIDSCRLLVCVLRTAPTSAAALSAVGCSARDRQGANEEKNIRRTEMIGMEQ